MKIKVSFLDEDSVMFRIRSFEDDFSYESHLLSVDEDYVKDYLSDTYSIPIEVFDAYIVDFGEELVHVYPKVWYEE